VVKAPVRHLHRLKGRWYWIPSKSAKKLGFRSAPLGADLHKATQQAEELNKQLDAERDHIPAKARPRSVADLIQAYRSSPQFEDRAPKTRKDYGAILDRIEEKAGKIMVADIQRDELVEMYAKLRKSTGEAMAAAMMRVWRILLGFAWDSGWRKDNPAKGMKLKTLTPRGQKWLEHQVRTLRDQAEKEGLFSMSLAVDIAYDLAQRQGDVIALRWPQWTGAGFVLRQGKTNTPVAVPVSARVALLLNAMIPTGGPILICETTNAPWKLDHFRHEFARIRKAAGLPADLQYRDLRRTALTEAGAAGATDAELQAVGGHKSRDMLSTYVVPTPEMATAAQTKRWAKKSTESKPDDEPV
jgi:hypothetical protein